MAATTVSKKATRTTKRTGTKRPKKAVPRSPAPRKGTGLKRARNPMPAWVRAALEEAGLMAAYQERPRYQRNDWLGWISRAKQEATRRRRLEEMLRDLRQGDVYMGMAWQPGRR